MIRVVGIRFQQDGKMSYFDVGDLQPHVGDYVIAGTPHGNDLGEVILGIQEVDEEQVQTTVPALIRIATEQDINRASENRRKEQEAFQVCQRKIQEHNLEMKLVSVETTFDNGKMMFYFTANGRVDFRALVKDLAYTFRTRIELRQIGVRDEARMLGGLGPCGRPICCGTFLTDFQPVSIKMAKEQNLSLNPTKISGVCGRLMCCLKYEQDQYEQTRKRMPRIGREVDTPDGRGTVCDLNVVKETVSVRIPSGDTTEIKVYSLDQLSRPGTENKASAPEEVLVEEPMTAEDAELSALIDGDSPSSVSTDSETASERDAEKPVRPRRPKTERGPNRFGPRPQKDEENAGEENRPANRAPRKKEGGHSRNKPNKDAQFGQPVRRENPEREKPAPEKREARADKSARRENAPAAESVKSTPAPGTDKSRGWADALEKAMKAADS